MNAHCLSRVVLSRIADKWTALIIHVLATGTRRYAELQREIGGISQKMLTQTLRSLERDGLVSRKVHPVVPPKVEYALTPLGLYVDRTVAGHLPLVGEASAAVRSKPRSRPRAGFQWRGAGSLGRAFRKPMHHVEPVVLLLVLVAGLVIAANKLAVPYPVLLVLGGLALSFVPFLPVIRLDPNLALFFFFRHCFIPRRSSLHGGIFAATCARFFSSPSVSSSSR